MKKLLTLSLLLCVILLTGCEKNRLVCTQETEDIKDVKTKSKYVFTFNEEDIKNVTMTAEVTLSGDYNNTTFINNYTEMATTSANTYKATTGISATVNNKKNVITLKVEMDPTSMDEESLETYGLNLKKDELKKELEDSGYTCK